MTILIAAALCSFALQTMQWPIAAAQFPADVTTQLSKFLSAMSTIPDCTAADSALTYSTTTQRFGCNTIAAGGGGGGGIAAGLIVWVDTGACPAGFSEVPNAAGRAIVATLDANGDVGTTGGSDTLTPAGTNATAAFTPVGTITWPVSVPTFTGSALATHTHTFTGSALATHAHELPWQIPTTTTIRQIAIATFGTGTSRVATAVSAAGTANTTSAAVALSQAITAGTPAGTNTAITAGTPAGTVAWPAGVPTFAGSGGTIPAQVFTGTPVDNRSAWVKMIPCKKT